MVERKTKNPFYETIMLLKKDEKDEKKDEPAPKVEKRIESFDCVMGHFQTKRSKYKFLKNADFEN